MQNPNDPHLHQVPLIVPSITNPYGISYQQQQQQQPLYYHYQNVIPQPIHQQSSLPQHSQPQLSQQHLNSQIPSGTVTASGMIVSAPMTSPELQQSVGKKKRSQVKNACVNCQKACKKCDDGRPCARCIKYGLTDTCVDSQRKERKKGVKRGPYKRRQNVNSLLISNHPIQESLSMIPQVSSQSYSQQHLQISSNNQSFSHSHLSTSPNSYSQQHLSNNHSFSQQHLSTSPSTYSQQHLSNSPSYSQQHISTSPSYPQQHISSQYRLSSQNINLAYDKFF